MRIMIVSDTHRANERFYQALKKTGPVDMVIHCGDAGGSEYAMATAADCPFEVVLGNNDFFSALPRELELNIGKYKVMVTHGHFYNVSMGNELLKEEAISRGMDIVMYGHTHRPVIDISDKIIAVNPGSLAYPRQYDRKPSYIMMEIDRYEEAHFTICYLD